MLFILVAKCNWYLVFVNGIYFSSGWWDIWLGYLVIRIGSVARKL